MTATHIAAWILELASLQLPDDILAALDLGRSCQSGCPEGPSTQYLGILVPETIFLMVFGTMVFKDWVRGPSGLVHKALSCIS